MIKRGRVKDVIFKKQYDWENAEIPFGDLPKDLLDTDIIHYESDPGFWSENNSWDPNTEITVLRERDQTDEEYQKSVEWWENRKEESRKARYAEYLKLKQEFEEGKLYVSHYRGSFDETDIAPSDNYSGVLASHFHKKYDEEGIE